MSDSHITVTFGKTTSEHLPMAVEMAARLPGYSTELDGKYTIHHVHVPLSFAISNEQVWNDLYSLIIEASRWKNTEITIGGKPASPYLTLQPIKEVAECYAKRQATGAEDDYCLGKDSPNSDSTTFGCRIAGGVSRRIGWDNGGRLKWYQCGTLSEDKKSFQVDKQKIHTVLRDRTAGKICVHCPAFSWERLQQQVDTLPEVIDLEHSEIFEVKYSDVNPSTALGIQAKKENPYVFRIPLLFGRDSDDKRNLQSTARNVPNVRYDDVAGLDDAIAEIKDVVQLPLTHPEYFASLGMAPHRGVILYGPPGNGKTLLVKAVATESNAHLEIINGPEILSKWVGQTEENLRAVFSHAREHQPSIILIDELDSIAAERDTMQRQYEITLISQLLVLLDGLEERGQVFVVGTTNRLEAVDPAIRRPGRFDYHIFVRSPDMSGRQAILRVHLKKMRVVEPLDLAEIARRTNGWSGADLAALCREAGLLAIKRAIAASNQPNEVFITQSDLAQAVTAIQAKHVI